MDLSFIVGAEYGAGGHGENGAGVTEIPPRLERRVAFSPFTLCSHALAVVCSLAVVYQVVGYYVTRECASGGVL